MEGSDRVYRIEIKRSAASEIDRISRKADRQRIVERIGALAEDPFPPGVRKLAGAANRYRLRQGPYRVVYEVVRNELIVYVVKVGDRKDVY